MKFDLVTIGEALFDIFVQVPSSLLCPLGKLECEPALLCFTYGMKMDVRKIYLDVGGSACNAAVAMAKLGMKVAYAGMIGKDFYGEEIFQRLIKNKVSTNLLIRKKEIKSGFAFILAGPTGERTIFIYRGEKDYKLLDLEKILKKAKRFYIGPLPKKANFILPKIARIAKKNSLEIIINPEKNQISDRKNLLPILKVAKMVFMNKEDAEEFTFQTEIPLILKVLKKLGPELICITEGDKGAHVFDGSLFYKIGKFPTKKVDTTGAGDAFASTFSAIYLQTKDIEKALKFAACNAASVVSEFGAQTGLLTKGEIRNRLKNYPQVKVIKII